MADKPDAIIEGLLEPGERVVYRDPQRRPPRWVPQEWPDALLFMGLICAYRMGPAFRPGAESDLLDLAVSFLLLVLPLWVVIWVIHLIMRRETAAVLTNRRVLYTSQWEDAETVDLPLAETGPASIRSPGIGYQLHIERPGGAPVRLSRLRKPQDFAAALARAAGQPAPRLIGRLQHLAGYGMLFGGLPCLVMVFYLGPGPWSYVGPASSLAEFATRVAGGTAAIGLAFWLGTHLAAVLGLMFLRSRVSAEQARNWFRLAPEDPWSRRKERWLLWKGPPYRWLARLLWGESMNGPNGGVVTHG